SRGEPCLIIGFRKKTAGIAEDFGAQLPNVGERCRNLLQANGLSFSRKDILKSLRLYQNSRPRRPPVQGAPYFGDRRGISPWRQAGVKGDSLRSRRGGAPIRDGQCVSGFPPP